MERGGGGWSSSSSSPSAAEEVRSAGEESDTAMLQKAIMLRGRCLGVGWVDKLRNGWLCCSSGDKVVVRPGRGGRRPGRDACARAERSDGLGPAGKRAVALRWARRVGKRAVALDLRRVGREACCGAWLTYGLERKRAVALDLRVGKACWSAWLGEARNGWDRWAGWWAWWVGEGAAVIMWCEACPRRSATEGMRGRLGGRTMNVLQLVKAPFAGSASGQVGSRFVSRSRRTRRLSLRTPATMWSRSRLSWCSGACGRRWSCEGASVLGSELLTLWHHVKYSKMLLLLVSS